MSLIIDKTWNAEQNIWEFKLIGDVDISNAQEFKVKLEAAQKEQPGSIVIDLEGLRYIDSSGLGVIIGTYGIIKGDGYKIRLVNPRDNVKKLLNISGLDKILC